MAPQGSSGGGLRLPCSVKSLPPLSLPEGLTLQLPRLPLHQGLVVLLLLHLLVIDGQPPLFVRIQGRWGRRRPVDLALQPQQLLLAALKSTLQPGQRGKLPVAGLLQRDATPGLGLLGRGIG